MTTTSVGWAGLAASLVLVGVAIAISFGERLRLTGSIVWASARAAIQLLLVGVALRLVLDPEASVWWAWLWVAVMIVFAGITIGRRAREIPGLFGLGLAAMFTVVAVSLAVIGGFGIFPLEGRTIVPLAGMMIGNSMTASVLVARRVADGLADGRAEVEARLALGLSWKDASRPTVRSALRTALIPQIESTKAVGLVFLPGAMTGLVLAGTDAVDAVTVQLAIMYLILGSVATSVAVIGIGLTRRLFTRDDRLRPIARGVQ